MGVVWINVLKRDYNRIVIGKSTKLELYKNDICNTPTQDKNGILVVMG